MNNMKIKRFFVLAALAVMTGLIPAFNSNVRANTETEPPVLPAGCETLQVPAGNEVFFRAYALGVQIYRWNGASWSFVAPSADLYASPNYKGNIGTHYAGPVWESNSGSKAFGSVLFRCTPDPANIPLLLLEASPTDDPGLFSRTTFIQRVNTSGGLAPTSPGTTVGEEKGVPYTAEYYFYREEY